jgi:hypothetical protein
MALNISATEIVTFITATAALVVSIIGVFISSKGHRLNSSVLPMEGTSRLWDRQNALDTFLLTHPKIFQEFMKRSVANGAYFYAPDVLKDELYYQLKGLTYLHLNFFEEIYLATMASPSVEAQFEGEKWKNFMYMKMRHALLKEVFINEQGSSYTGKFVDFLNENRDAWDLPTYSR